MLTKQNLLHKMSFKIELLSGLTVAFALVPEALAFTFVAGVEPLVGLYAAFLVGLITSIFGGRPGMISGAAGSLAVVMVTLVAKNGVEYLFLTIILMGIIEILVGVLGLGKFIRLIPKPVMLGFVNGLAILIFIAQLNQFKMKDAAGVLHWMTGTHLLTMIILVALTMVIVKILPKLTTAVPSSLAAIVIIYLLVNFLGIDTKMLGDVAKVGGGFPHFNIPHVPFTFKTLKIILPYSIILAAVGLMESLLTLSRIDEITETKGNENKECVGQGLANIVTGFFGGMGGCAMIGQSMINITSGGRRRLSGLCTSIFLLGFILFGSSLIEKIPLSALTGVMFMVVIETFEWSSFKIMRSIPKSDSFIIVLVSVVTVFTDLAIAVAVGIIVSSLVFVWKKGNKLEIETVANRMGTKEYYIKGTLFFASCNNFIETFDVKNDPKKIIINFEQASIFDHSALDVISILTERYEKSGKKLYIRNLSEEDYKLIKNADNMSTLNVIEDIKYKTINDIS